MLGWLWCFSFFALCLRNINAFKFLSVLPGRKMSRLRRNLENDFNMFERSFIRNSSMGGKGNKIKKKALAGGSVAGIPPISDGVQVSVVAPPASVAPAPVAPGQASVAPGSVAPAPFIISPPVPGAQIQQQVQMISTIELNQLIQDRNNLIEIVRTRDREIQCLQTQVRDRFDEVLLKENELKILKEENEMLKQRLKHVEDQLAATTADLVAIRSTLGARIESLEVKQEFDKYVVSIQDVNRAFALE